MNSLYKGTGVSKGIAIGPTYSFSRSLSFAQEIKIPPSAIDNEIAHLKKAVDQATEQLLQVKQEYANHVSVEVSAFIDTHLLMLADPIFMDDVSSFIREQSCNAQWALQLQTNYLIQEFENIEDPYLRSRKDDVTHVTNRIQQCLANDFITETANVDLKGQIIIADDLSPADTLTMQHQKIAGFITEYGGPLSHTAILARNLGIPAIVGVANARQYIQSGSQVILDGENGIIIDRPDEQSLKQYRREQRRAASRRRELTELHDKPTTTKDDTRISLNGNIDRPEDITILKRFDDAGVGLYRTEVLFIDRNEWPDEATQFKAYKRAAKRLNGKTLTIRTADLGSDKEIVDTESHGPMVHNPALGLRAIRRCLKEPAKFIDQLCAILRASAFGDIRMMIPMLTNVEEITQVLDLIEQAKQLLRDRKLAFDEDIMIGAMIEVPAAALSADAFAERLDFLSIGTNDLIQYTLALDRVDEEVNYLYNPLNPAVLRLIANTIDAGKRAGIPVSMCGEMASDTHYTRLLLGMGLTDFSVQPNSLLEVKNIIINSAISDLRKRANKILSCHDIEQIEALVDNLNGN